MDIKIGLLGGTPFFLFGIQSAVLRFPVSLEAEAEAEAEAESVGLGSRFQDPGSTCGQDGAAGRKGNKQVSNSLIRQ